MKQRTILLVVFCLALASIPAWAQNWTYDNGPINGTTDAWTINFGYIVSDTFTANPGQVVTSFSVGLWEFPGDSLTSLDWSITSGENSGTVYGSGTASSTFRGGSPAGGGVINCGSYVSSNQFGYDIADCGVSGLNVTLGSGRNGPAGTTYWLNLQNATVPSGNPVFWDENSGAGCGGAGCPSSASESAVGTIPSEAFTISGSGSAGTPEPSSFMLFGSGILGLAGLLRRKLF